MRPRLRLALVVFAAIFVASAAAAEPIGSHFTLTPFGGYTIFDGNLRFNGQPLRDDLYAGGRLGYAFNGWLGFELAGGFTPTAEDVPGGADVDFTHASGNLMLTPFTGRYGGPFLFVGGGAARFKPAAGSDNLDQGLVEAGGGLNFWFTDAIGLRLEARNLTWVPKTSGDPKRNYQVLGGGITLALGARPRDSDGDGVPDRADKCPDTPIGAKVDANGCPLDSDGDGVYDGLDQCPDTPKGCTVDARGCPSDADGDGVCDGLDQCADTPRGAKVDAKGCPLDSDGDGVYDGLDQCPGTPKGCVVDSVGCPKDTDRDGVCDGLDKCPNTSPGLKVDQDGCPIEIIERETELLDTGMIRLQDVNFATAKSDLMPDSHPVLDVVGQVLVKWPELRIEIGGHTDARGSDAYNQKLSEARANAVLDYLMQKFPQLERAQFTVTGYGESRPVAPNTNDLNMAKNRRVEFVVLNKDVLRREVERRKLLKKDESAVPDTTQTK
ncbi:MAG: hypothetical protein A2W00_00640 [Candidatus Eisenbacteria bacterium RBG_16_71_46]|nr:MAG: hypothetical protein A2W00_00640 [Candidatus Eisenbacteria bacterium RBG_16_71_46]